MMSVFGALGTVADVLLTEGGTMHDENCWAVPGQDYLHEDDAKFFDHEYDEALKGVLHEQILTLLDLLGYLVLVAVIRSLDLAVPNNFGRLYLAGQPLIN